MVLWMKQKKKAINKKASVLHFAIRDVCFFILGAANFQQLGVSLAIAPLPGANAKIFALACFGLCGNDFVSTVADN